MEPVEKQSLSLPNGENKLGSVHDENTGTTGHINTEDKTELSDVTKTRGRLVRRKKQDSESAVNDGTGHETTTQEGKGKQHRRDSGVGFPEDPDKIASSFDKLSLSGTQDEGKPNEREKSFRELWSELPQSIEPMKMSNIDLSILDSIFQDLYSSIENGRDIDPQNLDAVDNAKQRNALRALIMKAAQWGNFNLPSISKTPVADEKEDRDEKKSINPYTQAAKLGTPKQLFCTEEVYFTPRQGSPSCSQELFIKRNYPLSSYEEKKNNR